MGAVTTRRLGCEFDTFLYASVGDDGNGMPLTVLSALARLNIDPWEEAAKLMVLPQEVAVKQLASLLGTVRNASVANFDPARFAVSLVALLPAPLSHTNPVFKSLSAAVPAKSAVTASTLLSVLTYLMFMLFGSWLLAKLEAPRETQAAAASAAAADAPATAGDATAQRTGDR